MTGLCYYFCLEKLVCVFPVCRQTQLMPSNHTNHTKPFNTIQLQLPTIPTTQMIKPIINPFNPQQRQPKPVGFGWSENRCPLKFPTFKTAVSGVSPSICWFSMIFPSPPGDLPAMTQVGTPFSTTSRPRPTLLPEVFPQSLPGLQQFVLQVLLQSPEFQLQLLPRSHRDRLFLGRIWDWDWDWDWDWLTPKSREWSWILCQFSAGSMVKCLETWQKPGTLQ